MAAKNMNTDGMRFWLSCYCFISVCFFQAYWCNMLMQRCGPQGPFSFCRDKMLFFLNEPKHNYSSSNMTQHHKTRCVLFLSVNPPWIVKHWIFVGIICTFNKKAAAKMNLFVSIIYLKQLLDSIVCTFCFVIKFWTSLFILLEATVKMWKLCWYFSKTQLSFSPIA